jgi:hypothetical protein
VSSGTTPASERRTRLLVAQTLVSVLLLVGGVLLLFASVRLGRVWGEWRVHQTGLAVAAVVAALGAFAPWLSPALSVVAQRVVIWTAVVLASVITVAVMRVGHLSMYLGAQLLLTAAVLAEIGTRRRALAWFFWTVAALTFVVVAYYGGVSPRPGPD